MKVLVVEDEDKIAQFLKKGLTEKGYTVEAVKDAVPFWETMEKLGGKEGAEPADDAAAKLKRFKKYVDSGGEVYDKAEDRMKLLDWTSGVVEPESKLTGLKKLGLGYFDSLINGMLAVDAAQNGNWGEASGYTGNAVKSLRPMADLLFSSEALVTLGKADAPLAVTLTAVDLLSKYETGALDKKEVLAKKAAGQELMLALTSSIDGLKGKLRDLENLLRLMAEDQRCR